MNSNLFIETISDPLEIQRLESLIEGLVEKPGHLNSNWISKMKWTTVPVESAAHFDENDAELLSNVLQINNYKECFAIATESLKDFSGCYKVYATKESLLEFSDHCSHFNYILLPEDKKFSILCTVYDYFIIAGSLRFVEQAAGGSIDSIRKQFRTYSLDEKWNENDRKRLFSIAKKYGDNLIENEK